MHELEKYIRDIPDFPKPGILFKDITPLLKDPYGFKRTIEILNEQVKAFKPDVFLAIESRGFVFGGALAFSLNKGLVVARKLGKLPYRSDRISYQLEYGSTTLELHVDAITPGQRVVVIDDLLATGGTAAACGELIQKQGGVVAGYSFVVELAFLEGRKKLTPHPISSILVY
jgi:adenine phosphoribosyltransferase